MSDLLLQEDGFYLLLEDGDSILLESVSSISGAPLTGLILHSSYPAFINNSSLTGVLTISGTVAEGTNTQTFEIDLGFTPDIVDVMFRGDTSGDRPDAAWFRRGNIDVPFTGFGDSVWVLSSKIFGSTLIVTAIYTQTFVGTETLTATNFSYKVADYSIF